MTASVRGQLGVAAMVTATGAALLTITPSTVGAAENMSALRVDPELLGQPAAVKPAPASTKAPAPAATSVTQPPAPTATAPVPTATTAATPVSTPAAVAPVVLDVPAPAAAKTATTTPAKAAPASTPAIAVAPAPAATVARAAAPANPSSGTTGGPTNLPLLRVDPRLLGDPGSSATAVATAAPGTPGAPARTGTQMASPASTPPQVSGARIAPTYSAHVEAGRLPAPTGYQKVPHDPNSRAPIYITADRMDGTPDQAIVAEGSVELEQQDATLYADKVTYWQLDEETEAEGNVVLTRPDGRISGPKMRMRIDDNEGYFEQPNYEIKREVAVNQPSRNSLAARPLHPSMPDVTIPQRKATTGSGQADRIDFEGEGQYHLHNATYSTCPAGDNQDWYAKITDLKLDYDREIGSGSNARIYFKDVPFLYTPVMSFSLNNQRKSGLLPATFGMNSKIGAQYFQPYYWNIAPNMDATITSRLMTRRGLQVNSEFRYLDYNYFGVARAEYMPQDSVTGEKRYAYTFQHLQNLGGGFTGSLNLSGVSDDTYFTDLSTRIANISQAQLLRQGTLSYNAEWWSAGVVADGYQTLQAPNQPTVDRPYSRLPQLWLNAARPDLPGGLAFNLQGEYVNFSHPTKDEARRSYLYPQLSLPLQTSAFYITPKVGVSTTSYTVDRRSTTGPDSINRTIPIASLDTGVTFERDTQWDNKNYTQTLEPRLYYLYVPYRDQSNIPVFDTAIADFNFAQIFSENRYVGRDRIADANQVTASLTSRLIDSETGVEIVRGMLGQRYYFADQRVTLPGEVARTNRDADILAAVTGLVAPRTYLDTGWQYNPGEGRTERLNATMRYQPEIGKVMNAGYRYTRDLLGQIDVSAQWPLGNGWSGLGRYNFSTKDNRIIEVVAGFEYNAGCWAVRGVLQQLSTTVESKTTSFFVQLELSGFSNIGSNPGEILRRTIPGYGRNYGYRDATNDTSYLNY